MSLFSPYHPDYMSVMGTTVDRADSGIEFIAGE
jgi:hypothetical protein